MEQNLKVILDAFHLTEEENASFLSAKLNKVIVNEEQKKFTILIDIPKSLPLNIVEKFLKKEENRIQGVKEIEVFFQVEEVNLEQMLTYYPFFLTSLSNDFPFALNFSDYLKLKDEHLVIEVSNQAEERQFASIHSKLSHLYSQFGLKDSLEITVNAKGQENLLEKIQQDLVLHLENFKKKEIEQKKEEKIIDEKKDKPKYYRKKQENDPDAILGRGILEDAIEIKNIIGEDNNIVVTAFVFGVEYFESSKSDFKIITLKLTDYTDSIYCKVFVRDNEDYERLQKKLKPGNWFKIRGYTKNDVFSKEIVLNARDINEVEMESDVIKDEAPTKRVELHAHTMMSQMDGVVDVKKLIKQARSWGHSAIAITDHNGAQAYPDAYHMVCDINKSLKEGEKPFKVIYGTELVMIDDEVNIVTRPADVPLLDNTYVVFDFETTGFNAGGGDSIIEIGAVKIHQGEIIDRYDELINPGRKLPKKITEVTSITDEMLEGKDNEENAIKRFIEWFGDLPMVAHNAKFDVSFLEMAYQKYNLGEFKNTVIDTLVLSQTLDNTYSRHSLSALVKRYDIPWDESSHHRGDYDAEGTALVFHKMMKKLDSRNIETIKDIDKLVSTEEIHKYGRSHHVNLLVKNKVGLKNLFKIISLANTKYLYKTPRILRSEIAKLREGLLIGSGCYESEVFKEGKSKSDQELINIINFYDYVEVQPMDCYHHLLQTGDFGNKMELQEHLNKIIRVTIDAGKLIVATGDVHHLTKDDKIYREIIVNQKVPGGGRHPLARNNITEIPSNHFRTTDEMLDDFSFLDSELAYKIVVENPNKIADMVEIIEVIIETGGIPFSPKIENATKTVKELVYGKAHEMYGDPLPSLISDRIEQELSGIIKGGFDVIYLIAQKLVKKSNDDGYLVGSRGSVGSSFVATMMGITEVNPLPAHYLCKKCKHSIFDDEEGTPLGKNYSSGYDLPNLVCPKCGEILSKEGQDMPFATFLGFDMDKVPDIDLNFSGDYQWKAHEYTKVLFGEDNVYRAGTIGTVAEKTAYGYVKGYFEDKGITTVRSAEIERLAIGCTGVKRTTGQHPGGIVVIPGYMDVYDFTPFQYPADDANSLWRTTHFDYHAIDQDVLKLDILGHDDPTILRMLQDLSGIDVTTLPFDDQEVMSLLSSTKALKVTPEEIMCPTGTLGLPELGTKFVIQMLVETKPKTFSELVKISGLSHGTDVWAGNASELIRNNIVPFKEVIGCRDDIMVYLMYNGLAPKDAFKTMEFVRKGRPSKDPEGWKIWEEKMKEKNIPKWYIESCHKIKYMFPKAHACAYVMSALRIAWFKVHMPILYYASYFSIRITDFDIETMMKGYDAIKEKMDEINAKGYEKSNKEEGILGCLEVALEATARGIHFGSIDINKSDSQNFLIDEESNTLIPPFRTLDGLGINVATSIVEEREKQPFISVEDVQRRGHVSKTLIDKMIEMKILEGLPESNQLSLF